ncbi:hypothetical protein HAX54_009864 [Datura stramonium]|uniref:Uncharacterized protein n=1 Tax=Datura stramonium TaxID=4076 RepID=A0ABS8TFF3_DATST|nr:hypothetical protein [Datura stramonium]
MGPVLYTKYLPFIPLWYGRWTNARSVLSATSSALSPPLVRGASVRLVEDGQLYTDQTGANISCVHLGEEKNDRFYSHGKSLTRLSVQSVIKSAARLRGGAYPPITVKPSGVYLLLTSDDVAHSRILPKRLWFPLPFSNPIVDTFSMPGSWCGAISKPLLNAWYAGQDPSFPVEIADLCEGIYGTGGSGSCTGQMLNGGDGATYNMNGLKGFGSVVWNLFLNYCSGLMHLMK